MGVKTEFTSEEDVLLSFEPFVDKTNNGARIESGDAVNSVTVKRPNGTLLAGGDIPVFTRDADTKIWEAVIPKALFAAGKWKIRITSNNAGAEPQYRTIHWGVGATEAALIARNLVQNRKTVDRNGLVTVFKTDGVTPYAQAQYKDQNGVNTVGTLAEGDVHEQTAFTLL